MISVRPLRGVLCLAGAVSLAVAIGWTEAVLGICGPFTDVTDAAFCPFVLEIFYLGITTGTTGSVRPTRASSSSSMAMAPSCRP